MSTPKPNYIETYATHVAGLQSALQGDAALEAAVGGDFLAIGALEMHLLLSLGLKEGDFLLDIGCGSGRLASQLAAIRKLRYLGTDVVPDLLAHARRLTKRDDWVFSRTDGIAIPCEDQAADFACFFSVFTHLLHEDTFRYLREAKRVLKPGGLIVFSFLEFFIYSHWAVFEVMVARNGADAPHNQFIDRDAIKAWAEHLGLEVVQIADGDKPHIPIPEDIRFNDGRVMSGQGYLGQSVAVLRKP